MAEVSKNSVTHQLITENETGQRLDNLLLKQCKGVPKSHLYSIVRSGQVRVNGRRVEVSYRLQSGDMLRIPPLRVASVEQEVVAGAELKVHLPVVYEDEGLLVVDKPAGMVVHPAPGHLDGTLVNVGAPGEPLSVNVMSLIGHRRSFAGSMIGGIRETQEMLDFCAEHSIVPNIEVISADQIDEAYERVLASDVRYRFVIDTSTI